MRKHSARVNSIKNMLERFVVESEFDETMLPELFKKLDNLEEEDSRLKDRANKFGYYDGPEVKKSKRARK